MGVSLVRTAQSLLTGWTIYGRNLNQKSSQPWTAIYPQKILRIGLINN